MIPHVSQTTDEDRTILSELMVPAKSVLEVERQLELAQMFRGRSRERSRQLDQLLFGTLRDQGHALAETAEQHQQLKELFDKLLMPPWHPALFVGLVVSSGGIVRALVVDDHGARRVVNVVEDIDVHALAPGEEVYLGKELNVVLGRSTLGIPPCGETALFERWTGDGRLLLKSRDEAVIVHGAGPLRQVALKPGDLVRWDRMLRFAFEKIEQPSGEHLFLEEAPAETFDCIGGLSQQIEKLKRTVTLHLFHGHIARKYRKRRCGSVLLSGPPGTGKTMVARAFANWLARQSRSGRSRFINIKPASLHSSWYSQSEANYREAFRIARQAGEAEPEVPVVMFFDEVDSIGAARGQSFTRVDDRVLTAFMAELDGLESRGNILVLAATNRHTAIDPGLLRPGRLGDLVVEVPRPNMKAARDIFSKHLHVDLPYAQNGVGPDPRSQREHLLDAVISHLYAPNGDSDVAVIKFRDGKQRNVKTADLISGATIAKIADAAVERACQREVEGGDSGLQLNDLLSAVAEHNESAARSLTPATCRSQLGSLPDDVDVVSVEPIARRVRRPHRYVELAASHA